MNDLAREHGIHVANRNYNTMRAVFSWGLRKDIYSGDNPCIGVDCFKTQARERFIQPGDEYIKFAKALNEEPNQTIQDFFWICLFTGNRMSKVLEMQWNQVDFDLLVWRIPVTKNGDSQTLPLTPNASAILRRRFYVDPDKHDQWVFPSDRKGRTTGTRTHLVSPRKAWLRILDRAKIQDLRIHDLRRTAGSYMAIQGVSPTIIGKALGHRSPQATAIYARLTQDPVRQALENAQAALGSPEKLLPKKGNVIKMDGTQG
jgi:integrase